jgi:N-acetylglucosaminyl-diphospho-decaprenol L-rhamnosyltransferase
VSVEIIIVNWNGGPELLDAIDSGRRFGANVIVVDNASTAGSIGAVAGIADVQLVRNPTNGGFSAGCNRGVAAGRADIVMLLNPDAQILTGTVGDLEQVFTTSDAMLVAFPIEQPSGDPVPSSYPMPTTGTLIADILRLTSLRRRIAMPRSDRAVGPTLAPGDSWVVGAALAIRRVDWARLGGMDERFFLWYEDIDFGARAALAGGTIAFADDIHIRHVGASTWNRLSRRRRQWLRVLGSRRYASKHLGRLAVAAIVLAAAPAVAIGVALDVAHWATRRP